MSDPYFLGGLTVAQRAQVQAIIERDVDLPEHWFDGSTKGLCSQAMCDRRELLAILASVIEARNKERIAAREHEREEALAAQRDARASAEEAYMAGRLHDE